MKTIQALISIFLALATAACAQEPQDDFSVSSGPARQLVTDRTGTEAPANVTVSPNLVLEGSYKCFEVSVTDRESGELVGYSAELEGGTIRHREVRRFEGTLTYLVVSGGKEYRGSVGVTSEAEGFDVIDFYTPLGPSRTRPEEGIVKGLTSCKIHLRADK